jgi:hypothetical protein
MIIHHPLLVAAHQVARSKAGTGPYNYYFYSYIGNLLYYLDFVPECTWGNMILADTVYGCLLSLIEAILPRQDFPPNGVNNWALLQHEDTLNGEGW